MDKHFKFVYFIHNPCSYSIRIQNKANHATRYSNNDTTTRLKRDIDPVKSHYNLKMGIKWFNEHSLFTKKQMIIDKFSSFKQKQYVL